jgi:DNA-directed RNA polymerase specialized sigma24 family protein
MTSTATQLDQMLYTWLAEPDNGKFDQAFKRYYAEASSKLVAYLARRSSLLDLDCEQIAVDALLKFFCRVGRDRRQAAELVADSLARIQPLDFGPFHVRQVRRWTTDIGLFRDSSMSFTLRQQDGDERPWKAEIQALTDNVPPLQRQGCHLLEPVRAAVGTIADVNPVETVDPTSASSDDPFDSEGYALIREFATGLRNAAKEGSAGASSAEGRHPGVLGFVDGSWSVIDALPLLRVPTNGYLFDIAQSLYLDECKARGRKKRGGMTGSVAADGEAAAQNGAIHPLAQLSLDETGWHEEDAEASQSRALTATGFEVSSAEFAFDPAADQIGEEFCRQFNAYLRKPLEDAEEAYRQAAAAGPANAERKRLESISRKNERVITVLSMRIEGQTQEEIAEALGISRNQVKYIVELMQAAYEQFCAAAARKKK